MSAADIKETGDRMVYLVASHKDAETSYRVDLTANVGFGWCECKDWSCRRGPAIKRGEPIGTRATMCRHVAQARDYFLNGLLVAMAKSEERGG